MLDFSDDFNNAYMIYFVNFLGTLAVLPGNIVSALLMDKIGRLRMLGRKTQSGLNIDIWYYCKISLKVLFFFLLPQRDLASYLVSAASS